MSKLMELVEEQNKVRGLLWTEDDKEEFATIVAQECIRTAFRFQRNPTWGCAVGFYIEEQVGVPIIKVV